MSRKTWGTDIHTYVITIIVRKYYTTVHIIINTALLTTTDTSCNCSTDSWSDSCYPGAVFFWRVNLSSVLCSDDLTLKLQAAMPAGFRVFLVQYQSLNKLLTAFRRMSFTLTHRVIQQSSNHTKSGSGMKTMISKDRLLALWHPLLPHRL